MRRTEPNQAPDTDQDIFLSHVEELNARLRDLQRDGPSAEQRTLIAAAFEELSAAVEELRVADAEMQQQNRELIESRLALEAERLRYQDLFQSAPDAYLVTDLDGTIREVNRAASLLLGVKPAQARRRPLASFLAPASRDRLRETLAGFPDGPAPAEQETWVQPRRGDPVEVAATVAAVRDLSGGALSLRWLLRDITPRRQAEAERYRQVFNAVSDYAVILIDPSLNVVSWNRGAASLFGFSEAEMLGGPFARLFTPEDVGRDAAGQERREADAHGSAPDERWHVRKDGTRFWGSGILTALRDPAGGTQGYVKVLRDYTAEQTARLKMAADLDREHKIAEALQRALLPDVSEEPVSGLHLATLYRAGLEEAQVGGDFYDVVPLKGGRIALVVGDVSGKGLAAAARTAEIRAAHRAFVRQSSSPAEVLGRMNEFFIESGELDRRDADSFLTLAVTVLDPQTGEGAAAVAGAEPPLVVRRSGDAEVVPASGGLLGVLRETEYRQVAFRLEPGDALILVTDGITEARQGRRFLDYDGFTDLARHACRKDSLQESAQAILTGAQDFAGGSLHDDACLLLARRA